jgi:hypothetical protein
MFELKNKQSFEQLIAELPSTVLIPPRIQLELNQQGTTSTVQEDVRIAPRFRCKGAAIFEWVSSPAGLPISFPMTQVIVRNVSRTGFSILVDRQWFPEQIGRLCLPIAIVTCRVVRARRLGSRCFDIGVRISHYEKIG